MYGDRVVYGAQSTCPACSSQEGILAWVLLESCVRVARNAGRVYTEYVVGAFLISSRLDRTQ